jgi:hypothetical protein
MVSGVIASRLLAGIPKPIAPLDAFAVITLRLQAMNIPLKEYITLAIRHNDFAVVDSERKQAIEAEDLDKSLVFRQLETGLWQVWRNKATWLASAEHRAELYEQSKASRERNFAKADVIVKLKASLGLDSTHYIMPIIEALVACKAKNRQALLGLGLTDEDIELL